MNPRYSTLRTNEDMFQELYEQESFNKMLEAGLICWHGHQSGVCEECYDFESPTGDDYMETV